MAIKSHKATWYVCKGSASTCGAVRGDQIATLINKTQDSKWVMEIKVADPFFASDLVFPPNVAIIQRDINALSYMSLMRKKGTKLVFDIDDALWLLPNSDKHPEYKDFLISCGERERDLLFRCLDFVDIITVSTPELKKELIAWKPAFAVKTIHVANGVDPAKFPYFSPTESKETFDVLWYGAGGHHFNVGLLDKVVRGCLSATPRTTKRLLFHFMGSVANYEEVEKLHKEFPKNVRRKGWVAYSDLAYIISTADCVTCPIVPHPFTFCKSELKALEVATCGRFPLMADVPQYRRFAEKVLDGGRKSELLLPTYEEGNDDHNAKTIDAWVEEILKLSTGHIPTPVNQMIERTLNHYYIDRAAKRWDALLNNLV